MWMCGTLPLGYDRHPGPLRRELVVNPAEAAQVHELFRLYDAHGCLGAVERAAAGQGLCSKHQVFANGATRGGGPLSRGQIHYLLTNTTYRGLIRHRDATYPGLHPAIIEADLWDRVQARLQASRARPRGERGRLARAAASAQARGGSPSEVDVVRRTKGSGAHPTDATAAGAPLAGASLTGKLRDETGDRLTPTATGRRGRRFGYYVSHRLITGGADPTGWRLPADALEGAVRRVLAAHIRRAAGGHALLSTPEALGAADLAARASRLADQVETDPAILARLVATGTIEPGRLRLRLDAAAMAVALAVPAASLAPGLLAIDQTLTLRRRGVEARLVAGVVAPAPDPVLQRTLADAHRWLVAIRAGASLAEVARHAKRSEPFVRERVALAFLAPALQAAILDGRQPPDLTVARLLRIGIPMD